ncbi:MAG: VCBS repeat-containing protein [Bacteriovorax sp.]|nr:VCBS repeat-containing protein [Bacteriovorax sp.]
MIFKSNEKLFIGETEKFKFYFVEGDVPSNSLHDLFKVKTHKDGEGTVLIPTLKFPLSVNALPCFTYKFDKNLNKNVYVENFHDFSHGFVHARNYFQDHFRNSHDLDIVVFDHGYDTDPFPGGRIYFFEGNDNKFKENNDFLPYPQSFVFGGCSGDWDGDGYPELMVFNLFYRDLTVSLFLKNDLGQKMISAKERMPKLINDRKYIPLSGTKFKDSEGRLHLALGSLGNDFQSESEIILRNNGQGYFLDKDIKNFPKRRMGDDWCCLEMKTVNFNQDASPEGILALYHDAKVNDGYVEFYEQSNDCEFFFNEKMPPVFETHGAWISRMGLVKIDKDSKGNDGVLLLKARGLQEFTLQEYYITLLKFDIEKKEFMDLTEQMAPLKGKEFINYVEIENGNKNKSDFIFIDPIGNQYFCESK